MSVMMVVIAGLSTDRFGTMKVAAATCLREKPLAKITVAARRQAINNQAPGFTDYILDEQGALRRHVKLCINDTILIDRKSLTDRVQDDDTVFIFQASSGG